MKWFLPCLSLVGVALLARSDETTWSKVESKDGKCQIEFPGKPTERKKEGHTQYTLGALDDKAAYMLQFNDLPARIPIDKASEVKATFDRGEKALVNTLKGKITRSEDGKFGKYPSRDVVMEEVPSLGVYKVKFVLTGDKFYQVTVVGPADFVKGDDVRKFMESFKLND